MRNAAWPVRTFQLDSLIGSLLIVGSALVSPSTYIPVAQAQVREPTLQEVAAQVAGEYKIPTSTLFNLVYSESRWDPNAVGDGGKSFGLAQIHLGYNPTVTKAEALDPVFALHFASRAIKEETEYRWTVCNCYSLVKSKVKGLPRMKDIHPNTTPDVGKVAIFYYGKVKHVAYITKVEGKGFWVQESNYEPCLTAKRFIAWGDRALAGYWSASP